MPWERVSRQIHCPICDRDNWCMISDDGSAALCMRVPSDRPHELKSGETAYIHRLAEQEKSGSRIRNPVRKPVLKPVIDFQSDFTLHLSKHTSAARLFALAQSLGVPDWSLQTGRGIGCAWYPEYDAWGFPMMNGDYKITGIRLRSNQGRKWAITGSTQGIFCPLSDSQELLVVCEGPTDAAAGIACGLYVIGRPSCSGGANEILDFLRRNPAVQRCIIISDNDTAKLRPDGSKFYPGIEGAEALHIKMTVPSCIVTLPCKDLREFYNMGGTQEDLLSLTASQNWRGPCRS